MLSFFLGGAAVPKEGMQALPNQIYKRLKQTEVLCGETLQRYQNHTAYLESGHTITAKYCVYTCPHDDINDHVSVPKDYTRLCTYYMSSKDKQGVQKSLILSSKKDKRINHVCCISDLAPSYTQSGRLISATVVLQGDQKTPDETSIQHELSHLLSIPENELCAIKKYEIKKVLPQPQYFSGSPLTLSKNGMYIAGDWCYQGSIQGALYSAETCAKMVLYELKKENH